MIVKSFDFESLIKNPKTIDCFLDIGINLWFFVEIIPNMRYNHTYRGD